MNASNSRPARKWSVVALGTAGATAVVVSYLLFIALAIACVALPFVIFSSAILRNYTIAAVLLSAFGLVAGLTIFWSLIPRRDKSEVTGVLIDAARETRLMAEIEYVAAALGESMPRKVYLIPAANAFVAQRGGIVGIGSHRILALGLPLLATLSVSELRGLLAHEFAHFYSGDTRLAPWLFGAHQSMLRVYKNLSSESPIMAQLARHVIVWIPYMVLMTGLRWYWAGFMRLTLMISRQQEYRSDEIACRVAGSEAFIEVLRDLPKSQAGFNPYVESVVQPLLSNGYQPRIAEDFATFLSTPHNQKATSDVLEKELETRRPEPFDSHPPLALRIERARLLGLTVPECSSEPALSLFANLHEWETNMIRKFVPDLKDANLKPVNWELAATEIYLPLWRKHVESFLPLLADTTIFALPAIAKNIAPLADKVLHPPGRILSRSQREEQALSVLGCAFGLSLVDHGWKFIAMPGSVAIQQGNTLVKPTVLMGALRSGAMSADQWQEFCAEKGIGDYPLVQAAPVAQPESARA